MLDAKSEAVYLVATATVGRNGMVEIAVAIAEVESWVISHAGL